LAINRHNSSRSKMLRPTITDIDDNREIYESGTPPTATRSLTGGRPPFRHSAIRRT
jgi:hypothetical protein